MNVYNNGGSREAAIDSRRRLVAGMRLRHLTYREIVAKLDELGIRNPDTGEPYCLRTINCDVNALRKQWKEESLQDTNELVADNRAELVEVRRRAWTEGELAIVLRSLKQECDLLGLDAPTKIAPTDPSGTREYDNITDDERIARLGAILNAARERRDGSVDGCDQSGVEVEQETGGGG